MHHLPLRVLIADDDFYVRDGLISLIDRQSDMCVVAQAVNGQEAVELFRRHLPDVTLMDLRMPVMDGFEAIRQIRKEFSSAGIIVLTSYGSSQEEAMARQAGAKACLMKDLPREKLFAMIRAIG